MLRHGGIVRFARIDHAAIARSTGGASRPVELLQMENPQLVARLLAVDAAVAWALPIKALAWEDANGQVWLRVTDPNEMVASSTLAEEVGNVICTIEKILGGWVDESVAQG